MKFINNPSIDYYRNWTCKTSSFHFRCFLERKWGYVNRLYLYLFSSQIPSSWRLLNDRQYAYNVTLRRVRAPKAISITYSECIFLALVIQHAKRVRRIILPSVACPAVPYFSTLSHKRQDIREKFIEYKICVLIFSTTSAWNFFHSKKIHIDLNSRYSYQILIKLEKFHGQIFAQYSKINFLLKSVQWEPVGRSVLFDFSLNRLCKIGKYQWQDSTAR